MNSKYIMSGLMIAILGAPVAVQAAEFAPSSVRALSMGGSSVASTHGADATYWNPAAYGFFGVDAGDADNNGMGEKDFGLDFDIGAASYVFGPLETNRLKIEALPDPGTLTGALSPTQIQDAAKVVDGLSSLDTSPMGANLSLNATFGARIWIKRAYCG